MIAKNNNPPLHSVDIEGTPVHVGDEIVYSKNNTIKKSYILGFTQKGIYIIENVFRREQGEGCKYTYNQEKVYKRYLNFLLFKRNEQIPEEIKQFL